MNISARQAAVADHEGGGGQRSDAATDEIGLRFRAHVVQLCPVMKAVNPGAVAFRDQFRLGRQPMLHVAPLRRTLVQITEVGPSGHFVR